MSRRYPPKVHEFIKSNYKGRGHAELAALVNQEMGTDFTPERMKSYLGNHKLRTGTRGRCPSYEERGLFPTGLEVYVRSIAKGRSRKEIAEMVNEHFGVVLFTEKRMAAYMKNHSITTGRDTTFKQGHEPANKGKKQTDYMGQEAIERTKATRFKPQQKPTNLLQVGAVVKNIEGYLLRKKQMEGTQWERWEFLHRAVWEEHNGPIPEGMMVSFKDCNRENVDIDNLMLITNAENLELYRSGLRFEDPDLTETGLNVVRLKIKARGRRREP